MLINVNLVDLNTLHTCIIVILVKTSIHLVTVISYERLVLAQTDTNTPPFPPLITEITDILCVKENLYNVMFCLWYAHK